MHVKHIDTQMAQQIHTHPHVVLSQEGHKPFYSNDGIQAGAKTQRFTALAALVEELGLIPRTHIMAHNHL